MKNLLVLAYTLYTTTIEAARLVELLELFRDSLVPAPARLLGSLSALRTVFFVFESRFLGIIDRKCFLAIFSSSTALM